MIAIDRPDPVKAYLERAVAEAAQDITAVTIDLEGRIRLGDAWYDFTSTLEVASLSAFHWRARVRRGVVRFRGFDRYADGVGAMRWRLFGVLPVVRGEGADVTRSARGRAALEQVFLPSALARPEVSWSVGEDGWLRAAWGLDGEPVAIELDTSPDGRLRAVRSRRWSDAEGAPWRMLWFGSEIRREACIAGLTVPAEFSAGWFYGDPRWQEGQFFEGRVVGLLPGGSGAHG